MQLHYVNTLGVFSESSRRLQTVLNPAGDDCRHPAALMWSDWPEPGGTVGDLMTSDTLKTVSLETVTSQRENDF